MEDKGLSTVDLAVSFLEHSCQRKGVRFYKRAPSVHTNAEVVIVGTENGAYGSIGLSIDDGKIKYFCRDDAKYKWAKLEGFSEEHLYEAFKDTIVKEVSLQEMVSLFTS